MSTRKKITVVIIIIVLIFLSAFLLLKRTVNKSKEVKTTKVIRGDLIVTVSATGIIRSDNEAKLTTVASGRVNKIMVKENQLIKNGMVILELDSTAQAERDFQRLLKLGENGFIPFQQIELAKEQWKNTFITAPFTGTIAKKFVEVGETLFGGTVAFLIVDLTKLIFETNIDETDIGRVKVNQPAEIILDAYKEKKIKGSVSFIARTSLEMKEKGITYQVKIRLEPTDLILRLGMTGDVNIKVTEKKNVLMVPYTALLEEKEKWFVFVIENNILKRKAVKTGLENYDNTEIIAGLNENEMIVESKVSELKAGEKIKVEK